MNPVFDWQFALRISPLLVGALGVTVRATVFGMLIALSLGLVWALARRSGNAVIAGTAHWIVEFIRSTPLLIQLYFLFYALPAWGITLSPFLTGLVGLGLHYSCYTAEVYRSGIEAVPRGQWDAAHALSLPRVHVWRAIILPQAVTRVIPVLGNYFVAMFKDTPLLAAITVGELLQQARLIGAEQFRYLEPFTMVGIIFLTLGLIASRMIAILEKKYVVRH